MNRYGGKRGNQNGCMREMDTMNKILRNNRVDLRENHNERKMLV